ncbi:AAA family ATPase [Bacteroidia bacterium]|nr:AAA family ATPase [Bacteroidia bacterium]
MKKKEIVSLLAQLRQKHVLEAMETIDKSYIPNDRQSIAYNVLSSDSRKFYPPPLLIEIAYKISTNKDLPPNFFKNIGKDSPHFKRLEELGFTINKKSNMSTQFNKIIFKKVPPNEVGTGTEIAILKDYFTTGLIDDPKDLTESSDNVGSRSYSIKAKYFGINYDYEIKAYKTQQYKRDRRLIINYSNDPLGADRETDDYLAILFNDKITKDSIIEIKVIKSKDGLYPDIERHYKRRSGLVLSRNSHFKLYESFINEKKIQVTMTQPLNQILYGPPGTGKTYSTITKALVIIGLEYRNYEEAQELFQNELGKRIDFVTMHQSFSYEDFVQGLRPSVSEDGHGVVFKYRNGVFKEICERAEEYRTGDSNYDVKSLSNKAICIIAFFLAKYNGKKKNEKKANEFLGYESDNLAFIGIGEKINENPNSIKNHRDKFDYMFQNRENYTARNGWTPRNNGGVLDNTTKWPYREVYDELKNNSFIENTKIIQELFNNTQKPIEDSHHNENHVIILDEINRANISRVFGELIALIEKDKRDGKLTATLPSGEQFTVPSNLFIIGTMNTADKSIALVDIALRRRFEFEALYPNPKTLKKVLKDKGFPNDEIQQRVDMLTCLNRIIRAKKSVDFEIGHSYFMEEGSLINILNKQVLPLFNEYFMYDLKKVKEIIEKTQKDKEGEAIPKPGIIFNNQIWKEKGLLEVESIGSDPDNLDLVDTDQTS